MQTALLVATMLSVSATFWLIFVSVLRLRSVGEAPESSFETLQRVFGVMLMALGLRVAVSD